MALAHQLAKPNSWPSGTEAALQSQSKRGIEDVIADEYSNSISE